MVAMDASRDALFLADSAGYVHVLRLALAKGALQPLIQLDRIPPAGVVLQLQMFFPYICSWCRQPLVQLERILPAGEGLNVQSFHRGPQCS